VASIDFPAYLQTAMTNAGYPRPIDVERGTSGEVKLGVVARWLRGEGEEPSIRKLRPVAKLLGVRLLEMMVAAGLITAAEAGFEDDPSPPAPRPTLEDLVRASPDYSPGMKDAMSALLAAAREEDKRQPSGKR
jgi:transcriptional regulator with XRE-family HTH domain